MSDFFERLDTLLKANKTTQTALADSLGIRRANFADWKKNGNLPSADVAVKIAQSLGTTVEYLVTGETSNPAEKELAELKEKLKDLL